MRRFADAQQLRGIPFMLAHRDGCGVQSRPRCCIAGLTSERWISAVRSWLHTGVPLRHIFLRTGPIPACRSQVASYRGRRRRLVFIQVLPECFGVPAELFRPFRRWTSACFQVSDGFDILRGSRFQITFGAG